MKVAAIILAAGASSRFGSDKIFALVDGKPLLIKSLENYIDFDERIESIVIACRYGSEEAVRELVEKHFKDAKKALYYTTGGLSRSESVMNCIDAIDALGIECDTLSISDAARCYTSKNLISSLLESYKLHKNATPAIRRAETFKVIESGKIKRTLKNNFLYEIQTPQIYDRKKLSEAYRNGFKGKRWAVDDGAVYFSYYPDEEINIVDSEVGNIKITFPHDIKV